MEGTHAPLLVEMHEILDALADERSAHAALQRIDQFRRRIIGDGVFSIQRNVTTAGDPADEIRLRRFYSSEGRHYPVDGTKRKTLTPWTECLFVRGRVFVGEGAETIARHFDDHEQMRRWALQSVVNVPLMRGNVCYATFNVFGTRPRWQPQDLVAMRVLAMAAMRWVPPAPDLDYRFTGASLPDSMEA